jgi:hypothetical protein
VGNLQREQPSGRAALLKWLPHSWLLDEAPDRPEPRTWVLGRSSRQRRSSASCSRRS